MPYHTSSKPKMNSPKMNSSKKKVVSKKITTAEKFKEHKKHHSDKHIKLMKALMKTGLSFDKSHNLVVKFVK